ncbi:MAG: hypothetical protein JO061_03630 [Acidobacteriaceae bacterium]|nr:hypothetical protein [Acidobacteriaceae bacterium]
MASNTKTKTESTSAGEGTGENTPPQASTRSRTARSSATRNRSHKRTPPVTAQASGGNNARSATTAPNSTRIVSWVQSNSGRIITAFTSEANRAGEVRNYALMDEYLGVIQQFRQVCGLPAPQAQMLTRAAGV